MTNFSDLELQMYIRSLYSSACLICIISTNSAHICLVYNEDSILSEPCFRCGDGTCILPSLPRYHDDWGKPLWYLCDNVEHCTDGTDERSGKSHLVNTYI